MMALGIHPMSGIEVVLRAEVHMQSRPAMATTSQGVSRKHLSTVCVKSTAASLSVVTPIITSA